jgi:hypothetical protein
MRYFELLKESLSLMPVSLVKDEQFPNGVWRSVFPDEWTNEYDANHPDYKKIMYGDSDEELPTNPNYNPELDMNLSNANMRDLMSALGFSSTEDGYHIPIDQFINIAQHWLKQHIGKQAGGKDTIEEPREVGGKNINYDFLWKQVYDKELKRILDSNSTHSRMYDRAAEKGSKIIAGKSKEEFLQTIAKRSADAAVEAEKYKNEKPTGARMVHIGRPEGYLNKSIMRALKIAKEGKQHGATFISAY